MLFKDINVTFRDVTIASVNMPVLTTDPLALTAIVYLSDCYVQATYNGSSAPGLNYVVYMRSNAYLRGDNSVFALFTTPDNPTDIVMVYNEFSMDIGRSRLYSDIVQPGLSNIPTKLDFVGGKGNFEVYYVEVFLGVPGKAEFSSVSLLYPTGPLTLTFNDITMTNFIPGTAIPAGKLFQCFDPVSVIDSSSRFTLANVTITGLSSFASVSTTFPNFSGASYQNIGWDFNTLPSNGLFVDRYGGINTLSFSPGANDFSGDYTVGLTEYLLVYTGSGGNTLTLGPANNNGRIIAVSNSGSGPLTIKSTVGLVSPLSTALPSGSSVLSLGVAHGITIQYITSLNTWVATGYIYELP